MRRIPVLTVLAAPIALAACAVAPPTAPTVMALPGQGKSFSQFQQDDMSCRQYASGQSGGAASAQQATNNAIGTAVVGTALGAAAGAAIGSVSANAGAGAAIGGAAGLLAGSAMGANSAGMSAGALQQRYDVAYTQCMYSKGDSVQSAPPPAYGYPAYGYPAYGYPAYPPGYYYSAPSVTFGVGGGYHHW